MTWAHKKNRKPHKKKLLQNSMTTLHEFNGTSKILQIISFNVT
jgi:hypothetical protein